MGNLVEVIKQAALEAVETHKPVNILFGTVTSTEPLEISAEQKIILDADSLILPRVLSDFTVEMSVEHSTEEAGEPLHAHEYIGRKSYTVHNSLKTGENLLLLRIQGGQRFVVLGRYL